MHDSPTGSSDIFRLLAISINFIVRLSKIILWIIYILAPNGIFWIFAVFFWGIYLPTIG